MILSVIEAAQSLRDGRTVVVPTETVYGLAGLHNNPAAIAEIYCIKKRPANNPLILHCHSIEQIEKICGQSLLLTKLSKFWPGPLTLLLPHHGKIDPAVTAGSSLAAFRIPNHALLMELLQRLNDFVAAPSANFSGKISPTSADQVHPDLLARTAGILPGGDCLVGLESTIIKEENGRLLILRPGAITEGDLKKAGFSVENSQPDARVEAPGQSGRHYEPELPVVLLEKELRMARPSSSATPDQCIFLQTGAKAFADLPWRERRILSESDHESLQKLGHSLFRVLQNCRDADFIVIETVADEGLGRAINDRLRRAAAFTGLVENGSIRLYRMEK